MRWKSRGEQVLGGKNHEFAFGNLKICIRHLSEDFEKTGYLSLKFRNEFWTGDKHLDIVNRGNE